MLRSTTVSG